MTNYKNIGLTSREKKYLSRDKGYFVSMIDEWFIEIIAFIIVLLLALTTIYLVIDMFIVPEPVEAQSSDLQVHEEWAGQTVKYCKEYLKNNL